MIKPVPYVSGEIMTMLESHTMLENQAAWEKIDEHLKTWAESIIDECAGNFECTMEENLDDPSCNSEQYPVLMRESILTVKNQL